MMTNCADDTEPGYVGAGNTPLHRSALCHATIKTNSNELRGSNNKQNEFCFINITMLLCVGPQQNKLQDCLYFAMSVMDLSGLKQ